MKSIIVLIKGINGTPYMKAFHDWDWAELQLVKTNEKVLKNNPNNLAKLIEIPYEGEVDEVYPADIEITHAGSELLLMYLGEEVIGHIQLETSRDEELYHESQPPKYILTYNIKTVSICGVELSKMKITEELRTAIQSEAEAYCEEMIETIGEDQHMDFTNLDHKIKVAKEQLKKVKRGEMPTNKGKELIGKLSLMECINNKS